MSEAGNQDRLAVLIDADNAQPALIEALLAEIAKYGVASVKRIYGDWTLPNLKGWKDALAEHAIQPIQQFRYTVGKNATDSAMIIDAMDLLYTQRFDGFCLISSDSDFTRLAARLRESGLRVYGFGERKTPVSLVAACDRFIYVDVLRGADRPPAEPAVAKKRNPTAKASKPVAVVASAPTVAAAQADRKAAAREDAELLRLLREALDDAADDDGWAGLGAVGSLIAKRVPNFDSRNYGFKKLSDLVPALGVFEIEQRGSEGKQKAVYLRARAPQATPQK